LENFNFNILPVDVNVALATQYTGLLFSNLNINQPDLKFTLIKNQIIPVKERTELIKYQKISDAIIHLCEIYSFNPLEINRYLFLLGEGYCQELKCKGCPLETLCFYNTVLSDQEKTAFKTKIKSQ